MKSGQSACMFCISHGIQWRQNRRYIAAITTGDQRNWIGDITGFFELLIFADSLESINGFQPSQNAVRAMTYHNPRSARLKGDITVFPWLGVIQASAIILYPNLVRMQTTFV
jgi:hypothetical protein